MLSYVVPGDPSLKKPVPEVPLDKIALDEVQGYIEQMLDLAATERGPSTLRGMVGLAAPQVGIAYRIILVDVGITEERKAWGEMRCYINPEIVWRSEENTFFREGCFSVDRHISGVVPRSAKIKIKAYDRYGQKVEEELEGYTARIFQHEIDHLNGVRFPDRVGSDGALHWIELDKYPEYRLTWDSWPVRCRWETWLAVKDGKPYQGP